MFVIARSEATKQSRLFIYESKNEIASLPMVARNGHNTKKVLLFLSFTKIKVPLEVSVSVFFSQAAVLAVALAQPGEISFQAVGGFGN